MAARLAPEMPPPCKERGTEAPHPSTTPSVKTLDLVATRLRRAVRSAIRACSSTVEDRIAAA